MTSRGSWAGASSADSSASSPGPDAEAIDANDDDEGAGGARGDREARRRAEKRRRTALNKLVGDLTTLLPLVRESSRKIDKTGVLRLAAHEIRKEHVFGESVEAAEAGTVSRLERHDVAEAVFDLLDGFLLTATARGILVVVSANVRDHLGHAQIDLLGRSLFEFAHPEDAAALALNLDPSPRAGPPKRDFVVRLARGDPHSQQHSQHAQGRPAGGPVRWTPCRFVGGFRTADGAGKAPRDEPAAVEGKRRARRDRRLFPGDNDRVMVAFVRSLDRPAPCTRLIEASHDEYLTRHLVDGRIVHCDRRISLVAGYFADEVTGVSAFTFMHKEDVRWVIIALRQMYDQNKPYGESCYRLVSRTGRFMFLRSRGYLEVDEDTKVAKSFVCINSLISDEDGLRSISDMKRRYSAIIDPEERLAGEPEPEEEAALEDPHRLEEAIMHLITNLPSPATAPPRPSPAPSVEPPAVTIVPPNPTTVKTAIEKSLTLVKSNGIKRSSPSPEFFSKRPAPSPGFGS